MTQTKSIEDIQLIKKDRISFKASQQSFVLGLLVINGFSISVIKPPNGIKKELYYFNIKEIIVKDQPLHFFETIETNNLMKYTDEMNVKEFENQNERKKYVKMIQRRKERNRDALSFNFLVLLLEGIGYDIDCKIIERSHSVSLSMNSIKCIRKGNTILFTQNDILEIGQMINKYILNIPHQQFCAVNIQLQKYDMEITEIFNSRGKLFRNVDSETEMNNNDVLKNYNDFNFQENVKDLNNKMNIKNKNEKQNSKKIITNCKKETEQVKEIIDIIEIDDDDEKIETIKIKDEKKDEMFKEIKKENEMKESIEIIDIDDDNSNENINESTSKELNQEIVEENNINNEMKEENNNINQMNTNQMNNFNNNYYSNNQFNSNQMNYSNPFGNFPMMFNWQPCTNCPNCNFNLTMINQMMIQNFLMNCLMNQQQMNGCFFNFNQQMHNCCQCNMNQMQMNNNQRQFQQLNQNNQNGMINQQNNAFQTQAEFNETIQSNNQQMKNNLIDTNMNNNELSQDVNNQELPNSNNDSISHNTFGNDLIVKNENSNGTITNTSNTTTTNNYYQNEIEIEIDKELEKEFNVMSHFDNNYQQLNNYYQMNNFNNYTNQNQMNDNNTQNNQELSKQMNYSQNYL